MDAAAVCELTQLTHYPQPNIGQLMQPYELKPTVKDLAIDAATLNKLTHSQTSDMQPYELKPCSIKDLAIDAATVNKLTHSQTSDS